MIQRVQSVCILCLIMSLGLVCYGQEWQLKKKETVQRASWHGEAMDRVQFLPLVKEGKDVGLLTAGYFEGSIPVQGKSYTGGEEKSLYVQAEDTEGNPLWNLVTVQTTTLTSMTALPDGGVALALQYTPPLTVTVGGKEITLQGEDPRPDGAKDARVLKIDAQGEVEEIIQCNVVDKPDFEYFFSDEAQLRVPHLHYVESEKALYFVVFSTAHRKVNGIEQEGKEADYSGLNVPEKGVFPFVTLYCYEMEHKKLTALASFQSWGTPLSTAGEAFVKSNVVLPDGKGGVYWGVELDQQVDLLYDAGLKAKKTYQLYRTGDDDYQRCVALLHISSEGAILGETLWNIDGKQLHAALYDLRYTPDESKLFLLGAAQGDLGILDAETLQVEAPFFTLPKIDDKPATQFFRMLVDPSLEGKPVVQALPGALLGGWVLTLGNLRPPVVCQHDNSYLVSIPFAETVEIEDLEYKELVSRCSEEAELADRVNALLLHMPWHNILQPIDFATALTCNSTTWVSSLVWYREAWHVQANAMGSEKIHFMEEEFDFTKLGAAESMHFVLKPGAIVIRHAVPFSVVMEPSVGGELRVKVGKDDEVKIKGDPASYPAVEVMEEDYVTLTPVAYAKYKMKSITVNGEEYTPGKSLHVKMGTTELKVEVIFELKEEEEAPESATAVHSLLLAKAKVVENPFGETLTLVHMTPGRYRWGLYHVTGVLCQQGETMVQDRLQLTTVGLQQGIYLLRVEDERGGVRLFKVLAR